MRRLVWPRKGFVRSFNYFRLRVLRLTASPHAVAAGVAAGVISSCTPFVGLHFILAFIIAYFVAGNMIAAALGTAFGNPLTFPLLWASAWEVGNALLGNHGAPRPRLDLGQLVQQLDLAQIWKPVLEPMLVGSIPLAAVFGTVFYLATFYGVRGFQARRRAHLAQRAHLQLPRAVDRSPDV